MWLGGRAVRAIALAVLSAGAGALVWAVAVRAARRPPPEAPPGEAAPREAPTEIEVSLLAPQSVAPPADESCPTGMVLVAGPYCRSVAFRCLRHLDDDRLRCAEFAKSRRCFGPLKQKRFCIDRFEYPNREGAKPRLAVTWEQASELCQAQGRRLCTESEWTLACEGPAPLPYPYGFLRDSSLCNIDRPYRLPNNAAYADRRTRDQEVARLDQSEASGTRSGCVSPYGVYDMTGNVDEWVLNEQGGRSKPPFASGLKGGYWGPVRTRCRPITDVHNMWHSGYQIGFRCCADAPARVRDRCDAEPGVAGPAQCVGP